MGGACSLAAVVFLVTGHGAQGHRLNSVTPELSCSVACGISPDQGLNLCLLHWQADPLPLSHQGNSVLIIIIILVFIYSAVSDLSCSM